MNRQKIKAKIIKQEKLTDNIYDMYISAPDIARNAKPGQFVSLYTKNLSKLLPRPISICDVDEDSLRLVYRVTGEKTGTAELSLLKEGDSIDILGSLGNGFPLDKKDVLLIGGGIGIPPLLYLCKSLEGRKKVVLGYRDSKLFLKNDFDKLTKDVFIATEDGSLGTKGNVIDAIKANGVGASTIMCCGPTPMLRAVKEYALENNIECYLSLEERMACGVGACLACVCKSKEVDEHSRVNNKRVCKDGPVFLATEVEL